jgi:hypothetical protein
MATLASVLEDGTVLVNRYVTDAPNYQTFDFRAADESDIYKISPHGLTTVEIVQPLTRIGVRDNRLLQHKNERLVAVKTAHSVGYMRPKDVLAPGGPSRITTRLDRLGDCLRNFGHPILLKVGDGLVPDAYDAKQINHAKAQMLVVDRHNRPALWVASRHSNDAVYVDLDIRSDAAFLRHQEVKKFMDDLDTVLTEIPATFWRPIRDAQLAAMALYGHDFGGRPGPNNVNVVGQGEVCLTGDGDTFSLGFEKMWVAPDVSKMTARGQPVIMAYHPHRGARRGFRYEGKNYDINLAIAPYARVQRGDNFQI